MAAPLVAAVVALSCVATSYALTIAAASADGCSTPQYENGTGWDCNAVWENGQLAECYDDLAHTYSFLAIRFAAQVTADVTLPTFGVSSMLATTGVDIAFKAVNSVFSDNCRGASSIAACHSMLSQCDRGGRKEVFNWLEVSVTQFCDFVAWTGVAPLIKALDGMNMAGYLAGIEQFDEECSAGSGILKIAQGMSAASTEEPGSEGSAGDIMRALDANEENVGVLVSCFYGVLYSYQAYLLRNRTCSLHRGLAENNVDMGWSCEDIASLAHSGGLAAPPATIAPAYVPYVEPPVAAKEPTPLEEELKRMRARSCEEDARLGNEMMVGCLNGVMKAFAVLAVEHGADSALTSLFEEGGLADVVQAVAGLAGVRHAVSFLKTSFVGRAFDMGTCMERIHRCTLGAVSSIEASAEIDADAAIKERVQTNKALIDAQRLFQKAKKQAHHAVAKAAELAKTQLALAQEKLAAAQERARKAAAEAKKWATKAVAATQLRVMKAVEPVKKLMEMVADAPEKFVSKTVDVVCAEFKSSEANNWTKTSFYLEKVVKLIGCSTRTHRMTVTSENCVTSLNSAMMPLAKMDPMRPLRKLLHLDRLDAVTQNEGGDLATVHNRTDLLQTDLPFWHGAVRGYGAQLGQTNVLKADYPLWEVLQNHSDMHWQRPSGRRLRRPRARSSHKANVTRGIVDCLKKLFYGHSAVTDGGIAVEEVKANLNTLMSEEQTDKIVKDILSKDTKGTLHDLAEALPKIKIPEVPDGSTDWFDAEKLVGKVEDTLEENLKPLLEGIDEMTGPIIGLVSALLYHNIQISIDKLGGEGTAQEAFEDDVELTNSWFR